MGSIIIHTGTSMEEDKVLGWRREPIQKQAVKISGRKV